MLYFVYTKDTDLESTNESVVKIQKISILNPDQRKDTKDLFFKVQKIFLHQIKNNIH